MPLPMSPERRAEGLAAASRAHRSELLALAEEIAMRCQVEVTDAPTAATLMVELEAPVGELCLSEVVVTYAAARVDGRPGWACIPGWDDEAALAAALCDALADSRVEGLADASLEAEAANRLDRSQAVAATRLELA